ncbi:conserved hypothetical protein [Vibrio phage 393E50-1]|nr:conserved hypothetical protein [Vibrio phage 393E50-1]
MLVEISRNVEDLVKLNVGDGLCLILENVDGLDATKYHHVENVWGQFIVYAKPTSYRAYSLELLRDLVEFPEEVILIHSFGKKGSERATIHDVAISLGLKVGVSYLEGKLGFEVTIAKKGARRGVTPSWWYKMKEDETIRVKLNGVRYSTFRSRVYRLASVKGVKVSVDIADDCEHVLLTLKQKKKSNQAAFLQFLSTIPELNKTKVPEEFSEMTDNYIRVLLTKHVGTFSYKAGYIRRHPTNQGPHIDKHGNFIYIERNYGPRPPAFIKLKLQNDTSDAALALLNYMEMPHD